MDAGAAGSLLVREREELADQITQPSGVGEDLDADLAVPDQDIAAFGLDDHVAGRS